MRLTVFLPLAALALLPACKQAEVPVETAADTSPVAANAIALKDERRVLDLEGGVNFRDLGGYRTTDGRVTKWKVLYRAGSPAGLTAKDQAELARRGIRTVCDFRTTEERGAEPNPFVQGNPDVTYWTRDYETAMGDLGKVLSGPDASAEKSRAALIAGYKAMPEEHKDSFRAMFGYLAKGQVPLAFNCSAGKDRTGIAAALVLTLLGVPRETVVADYALSDDVVDYKAQMRGSAAKNPSYAFLTQLPWEVVEPLLASDPAYIEAALEAIAAEHGSVNAFITNELGVTPSMKQAIVENLTAPA
jgi:protein-tyrosine phosphatase